MQEYQKTNWRERVKPEWLYINHEAINRGLVKRDTPVDQVEDRHLCIKLAGLRALALERGYSIVDYQIVTASADYVAMKCSISWDETENEEACIFSSTADAHLNNTKDFCQNFLCAIAENRAFSRCIRNFLNIEIVSDAELGDAKKTGNGVPDSPVVEFDVYDKLNEAMAARGLTFEKVKAKLTEEGYEGIENINSIRDLDSLEVMKLTNRINKAGKSD